VQMSGAASATVMAAVSFKSSVPVSTY
jgi:hypothetical protein